MRQFLWTLTILICAGQAGAQDCGFIDEYDKGDSWTYTVYNKKGKEDGKMDYVVEDKRSSGDSTILEIRTEMQGDKKKEEFSATFDMACLDGNFYLSMKNLTAAFAQQMEGMEMEIVTDNMVVPVNPAIGQSLPDAVTSISASMNGTKMMDMTITITGRKVIGKETITTDAGTFECFIIEQTTEVKSNLFSITTSSKEWYNASYGMVKSESYDKKGELESTTLLTSVSR